MEENLATIGKTEEQITQEVSAKETSVKEEIKAPEPTWWVDEGMPGQGNRPDYLEEKYGYVMAKQAKAYKEAEKKLGTIKPAPEQYEFGEYQDYLDKENQHIKDFMQYAKENKIQQDTFGKFIGTIVEYEKSKQPVASEEIAKLGSDGMQKVNTLQNWVKNNLTEKSAKALEKLPVKAEVIQMLDEVRQLHLNTLSRVPSETQKNTFTPITKEEIEAEMFSNYARYQADPAYRAQITSKFAQIAGTDKG